MRSIKKSQNIPKALVQSIKNNILNIPIPNLHKVKIDDLDPVNKKCNDKFLRQYLVNTLSPGRTKSSLNLKDYNKSEISTIQTKYLKFPIPPECKKFILKP